MKKRSLLTFLLLALLVLAACSNAEPEAAAPAPTTGDTAASAESAADSAMADETMGDDGEAMDSSADEMMDDAGSHDEDAMMDDDADSADAAMADDASHGDDAMMDDAMAEDEMMDSSADEMMDDDPAMGDDTAAADLAALPAWQTVALTDARTGESFTLADFNGQTVFVEPMATWCTNCRRQLENVSAARPTVGDDVVFIALSLETNLEDAQLAAYADQQGFDWLFAVMTPDLLSLLADEFGRTITSAPSTPHFVIRPDGSFTDLTTGIDSPEQIAEKINAAMEG